MIDKCLPALAGSALLIGLVFWDILTRNANKLPTHLLLGLLTILLFLFLCSKGYGYIGWVIFALPFILVTLGYISTFYNTRIEVVKACPKPKKACPVVQAQSGCPVSQTDRPVAQSGCPVSQTDRPVAQTECPTQNIKPSC